MYESESFIQIQTPDSKDIIVLEKNENPGVTNEGIIHFGFRLQQPTDVQELVDQVESAGGRIKESGEFVDGEPYVFAYDPDGYEIEIWYEQIPPGLDAFS